MITNHSYPPDKCTFELLSAYLDGEVTAQQRQEVEKLLAEDERIRALYKRLLYLRDEFQNLPAPPPPYPPQQLAAKVFAKVDEENKKRRLYWGTGAVAAVVLAAIASVVGENRTLIPQMAQKQEEELKIALNEPVVELPEKRESLMIPLDRPLLDTLK
ncbi:MAG: hypothetical protein NZ901_11070 [Geminocystis sp.]|nr:hypothetical protein [Geminocystis sp.]MCS7148713.1 hypothetical protein [Geminocystis sp.]MCX8078413.1 hypothetical protein [Geminocystis sp.]MDW8116138.1 hypothetical protein [Geminocystis sp.]MDW8463522.1 hypothetical protein [Geminocystis sp.]